MQSMGREKGDTSASWHTPTSAHSLLTRNDSHTVMPDHKENGGVYTLLVPQKKMKQIHGGYLAVAV